MFFDDEDPMGKPTDGGMANDGSMPADDAGGEEKEEGTDGGAM